MAPSVFVPNIDENLQIAEMLMDILLVYAISGITLG